MAAVADIFPFEYSPQSPFINSLVVDVCIMVAMTFILIGIHFGTNSGTNTRTRPKAIVV